MWMKLSGQYSVSPHVYGEGFYDPPDQHTYEARTSNPIVRDGFILS